MKKTVTYIDPPSGWKYGFPRILPDPLPEGMTVEQWLILCGYPQKEIDSCGKYFYTRQWQQEIDIES